ncbi:MAG: VWA domain-containing protein, partial [bacterium]
EVTDAARRATAALYFLDARGLATGLPVRGNAENNSLEQVVSSNTSEMLYVTLDTTRLDVQGADTAAIDSGGFTLRNSNDLSVGMKRIASESRTYYLLGYTPTRTERDGKFRKISVQVKRPGVKVRARKGYFAPRDGEAPPAKEGDLDPEIRRALDAPFGEAGVPLRTAAYVFHDSEKGKAKVILATEADPAAFAFKAAGDRSEDTVEAFFLISSRDTGENFHKQTSLDLSRPAELRARLGVPWLPVLREFDLAPGVYQSRVLVREKNGAHAGVVTHDFEVPPLGALRIGSPVLTDTMQVGNTPQAPPRPALIARRTFTQGGKLYCQFDVYGATPDPATNAPRVSAGHVLKKKDGPALANAEPTPLVPTAQGQLSRTLAVSLRPTLPGDYELVLKVRDDVSGKTAQVSEAFTVEAAPGGVAPVSGGPAATPEPRASGVAAPSVPTPTDAAGYLAAVEKYRTGDTSMVAAFADGPRSAWDGARAAAVAGGACKSNCLRAAALLHT